MAVLCRGLEKNGMVRAWHGHGMESLTQTRPHCVNQTGKTHSKALEARLGRGKAWARHAMCESAFRIITVQRRETRAAGKKDKDKLTVQLAAFLVNIV
jgi:hypothetical protein